MHTAALHTNNGEAARSSCTLGTSTPTHKVGATYSRQLGERLSCRAVGSEDVVATDFNPLHSSEQLIANVLMARFL